MGVTQVAPVTACTNCGYVIALSTWQHPFWRKTGHAYCSPECGREGIRSHLTGQTGKHTAEGRAALSQRMTKCNPMSDPEVRARQATTLRAIGHRPPVQGGNGRGLTQPQRLLSQALGWPTEVVVKTGNPSRGAQRVPGIPSHFKLDIANPQLRIAVEVDGESHRALAVRARDQRKDAFLTGAGWSVLRFSNREVMADTEACVRMVLSTTWR